MSGRFLWFIFGMQKMWGILDTSLSVRLFQPIMPLSGTKYFNSDDKATSKHLEHD